MVREQRDIKRQTSNFLDCLKINNVTKGLEQATLIKNRASITSGWTISSPIIPIVPPRNLLRIKRNRLKVYCIRIYPFISDFFFAFLYIPLCHSIILVFTYLKCCQLKIVFRCFDHMLKLLNYRFVKS